MANDLNQCNFIGRLGRDPEVRYLSSGKSVANFSIAVGQSWKDQAGQKQEKTEWVPVSAFGKLAEIIGEYVKKGSQVYVSGRFQTREYEKDGQKHYRSEIIAGELQLLGSRDGGQQQPRQEQQRQAPRQESNDDYGFDDEVPFN